MIINSLFARKTISITNNCFKLQNAIYFNTTVNGNFATIQVTSNTTDLFIGFNYTSTNFAPVNQTGFINGTNLYG